MSTHFSSIKIAKILVEMDVAREIGAYESLSRMIEIFGSRILGTNSDENTAKLREHMEVIAEARLQARFNGRHDIRERGGALQRRKFHFLMDTAAMDYVAATLYPQVQNTPLESLRRYHEVGNVAVVSDILSESAGFFDQLAGEPAVEVEKIKQDLEQWRKIEGEHGKGAMLNLDHPLNVMLQRLHRVSPIIDEEKFENAARYGAGL
ncbi:hypothetical protein [Rhizobium sp. 18055]|uniref:hypothetical protein n=1 Tax=Rhizobium sp. 18055 TaxID=2681403 RepID=UPI00135A4A71|nr:hypothetical protein [Rhizobium sp. 18055]